MTIDEIVKNILDGTTEFEHDNQTIVIPNKDFLDESDLKYMLEEDDPYDIIIDIEDMAWEYFTNSLSIKVHGLEYLNKQ